MQSPEFKAEDDEPDHKRKRNESLPSKASRSGSIAFDGDAVSFKQHIERPSGRELHVYIETAAACVTCLLQCEGISISQRQQGSGQHGGTATDVITLSVPLSIVLKLPVLKDLWEVTVPQQENMHSSPGKIASEAQWSAIPAQPYIVPFSPPVAIWALASLILVQEDKVDMWSLFGNVNTDPRLAAHTILMSDFCGDETAGGKVRTWLYRQAMPRVAALCTAPTDVSHSAPVVWHLSEVFLALPEEHMPFIDESQRKRSSAAAAGLAVDTPAAAEGDEESRDEDRVSVRFALQLPPPLLNAWLRRQRRVTVDFRELQYEDGPTALVALTGATHLQELTLRGGLSQRSGSTEARLPCIGCGKRACTFKCTSCTRSLDSPPPHTATKGAGKHSARLLVTCMHAMCAPLSAVQSCLVSLSSLRKLHMHGVHVLPGDLAFFGVVARALSGTLVHLTLCTFEGEAVGGTAATAAASTAAAATAGKAQRFSSMHKELLFTTIAMFTALQTLQLTNLLQFVAGQDAMMLAPLNTMPSLKTLIFSHQVEPEQADLARQVLAGIKPEIKLLDSPCGLCG